MFAYSTQIKLQNDLDLNLETATVACQIRMKKADKRNPRLQNWVTECSYLNIGQYSCFFFNVCLSGAYAALRDSFIIYLIIYSVLVYKYEQLLLCRIE